MAAAATVDPGLTACDAGIPVRRGGGLVNAVAGWQWPVPEDGFEVDPDSGLGWSADDELAATAFDEFERSCSPWELREWHEMVVLGNWPRFPEFEDAWARTMRVPPRPLRGVTGVTGAALAAVLDGVDPAVLSPAQLVELMTGAERLSRWAQGVQLAAVRAFAEYAVITDPDTRDHPLEGVPGGPGTVEVGFGTQREVDEFCADGIGAALGVSYTAAGQLVNASYLAEVPVVKVMLAAGQLDISRAKVFARQLAGVPYSGANAAWVDRVIADHHLLTPRKLERTLKRLVMERSPDGHAEVHDRELTQRRVWVSPQDAGMAIFSQYLTAQEAMVAYQAVNAEAWALHDAAISSGTQPPCQQRPGGFTSLDSYRADAFMASMNDLHPHHLTQAQRATQDSDPNAANSGEDITRGGCEITASGVGQERVTGGSASGGGDGTGPPSSEVGVSTGRGTVLFVGPDPKSEPRADLRRRGRSGRRLDPARVMLHVYMAASTVAGMDDKPADLLGYGPIPADQARELVEGARLTRILTDPFSGDIRSVDSPSYRVPRLMRWAMQARDRTCVFPSCDVPAYDVQADHGVPHPFGRQVAKALAIGTTTLSNLWSLCTHHHRLKTHAGWSIQSTRGARLEWISPTGHSYLRNADWGPPQTFWPDHPPAPSRDSDETCPF